ncbi:N-acetylglucosamine-6-phosphate deacetylase [Enterococcus sp. 7F3_DIV0205]|uniref:N-acetylglucosamine-6-phosphate deacetylase n=1 Tax=Candidatus Enterococcus palustris TaxID=1834189 RepID=A0AAQ3Y5W1_9ENTE|nr:N-acetylglucosamine-6-phosphate deacetylase [Enterococcus sp. 7F3_DIV0205]OTN82983.1 N-acetylglucosamine-6-phosphate deacetylase [Enterococcus sp. 7F3_DIV0205]
MKTLIQNATISTGDNLEIVDIMIDNGIILEIEPSENDSFSSEAVDQRIDGHKQLLIPGMIDVHIHGANNFDMMDGTTQSIQEVSKKCLETGCTGFLVTSVTSSLEALLTMIDRTKEVIGNEEGAKILGIHLEGPYLNSKRKGMQDPNYLRNPDLKEMDMIFDRAGDLIKMVTVAPELPGCLELITYLKEKNVVVAIAHSDATYEEAQVAFQHGATHITHCFNAMPPIHHRTPGLVTAALENDEVSVQAIIDGVHLHPGIVRLLYKIKGSDGMVLITDALQAMGVGDGAYEFGGHHVTVENGIARLKDGTLASSTVTMNEALKLSVEMGILLDDAIKMGATTPAAILGEQNIGKIAVGFAADLILLDEEFRVVKRILKGTLN